MGYILLLLFFLTWLESRKIRRAVYDIAYENGRPPSKISRIMSFIDEAVTERKNKIRKKVQSNEPDKK